MRLERDGRIISFSYIKRAKIVASAEAIDKNEFMIGYKWLNKLNNVTKRHKDRDLDNCNNNVVYKINCKDCDAS